MSKEITIICGATSTGKSSFAIELAKKHKNSLIISADSRQFYKGLPVVSGQDDIGSFPDNVTLIGQGFLSPNEDFSISQFKKFFYDQLNKHPNHTIFVVGGSGLYLKAITSQLDTLSIPQNLSLRQSLENKTTMELQEILKEINKEKFNSLNNSDIQNPRRLIRAIEVATFLKTNNAHANKKKTVSDSLLFSWVGFRKTKENQLASIRKRVLERIDSGAIEEVKNLLKNYPDQSLPIYTTLGVKEIIDFLNKKIDKDTLVDSWVNADLSYAKRQMVWFKKQPQIVWYDKGI